MKAKMFPSVALPFFLFAISLPKSLGFSAVSPPPTVIERVKDTKVAVDGRATASVVPPPHVLSHNVTLSNYMRLPVEQYVLIPMPLGSSLTRIANGRIDDTPPEHTEFELVVPTIKFFWLTLQPVVYATVQPQENRVVIRSESCVLRGSPFIEKVQLNDRFDFCVNTTLTWEDASQSSACVNNDPGVETGVLGEAYVVDPVSCSITAETQIDVNVDVPRPFSSLPKAALERTGNAAMRLSLRCIQRNFVDNLARDYHKWASDAEYRSYRASLSETGVGVVEEEALLV
ncbi:hypothetical protein ACHAWF_017031 [Thalassiosira exigua]